MDDDLQRVLRGPAHRFHELSGSRGDHAASCVDEVLREPSAVFEGVREFQDGGWCYCGIPSRRWFNSGSSGPPPPGMVFTVFVSPRGHVFEWRWERCDELHRTWPKDYAVRFTGGVVWSED